MTKEKKIGVSKIVIQMGDKEATLTVEQAKELRDALNELLGERVVERVIEKQSYYPYYPQPYVYVPSVLYGNVSMPTYEITCSGDTRTISI
jgi:hypothetical protein